MAIQDIVEIMEMIFLKIGFEVEAAKLLQQGCQAEEKCNFARFYIKDGTV